MVDILNVTITVKQNERGKLVCEMDHILHNRPIPFEEYPVNEKVYIRWALEEALHRLKKDWKEKEDEFINVEVFKGPDAKERAIQYCKNRWGADDEGKVLLLSIQEEESDDQIHPHNQSKDR